jgi:hypothetical protein
MGPDSVAAQPLKLQLAEIRTMIAALEVAPRLDIRAKETHREKEDQEQNRDNEGPGGKGMTKKAPGYVESFRIKTNDILKYKSRY